MVPPTNFPGGRGYFNLAILGSSETIREIF